MLSPLQKETAPRLASASGLEKYLHPFSTPTYAGSLGVRHLQRRFRISSELAAVVVELSGLGRLLHDR